MAVQSTCAKLLSGQDSSCLAPARKYYQQAVVINKSDIDSYTVSLPAGETCEYSVEFSLKTDTTGYRIQGAEAGASFFGNFDKSRSDLGQAQYIHRTQILVVGITEEAKCILDSLDKGSFVVALQSTDGTVEIYGIAQGMSTADYTYDIAANGGGTVIALESLETAPESTLPLVYSSADPTADFDEAFANPST